MNILSNLQILIFINIFELIISLRYPLHKDLDNSTGQIDLIEIETRKSYINYTKENKVISLFYGNYCKYCNYLLEIFKWASTYDNVSDWKFLSINCTKKQLLCNNFNITKLPTIKTHINKTEMPYQAPLELIPLLEYLIKLSTSSFIEIDNKNISKFYLNYGYFSPVIEYKSNDTQFYKCIIDLANNQYKTHFYFGMKKILDSNNTKNSTNYSEEKIIFDNNRAPFVYIWDNNCSNAEHFLGEHIFPLITIVNEATFFYELNKSKKLLIMLFGFLSNNKTTNFVDNQYKYLAHEKNKFIFSFLNYSNTKNINHYFNVRLYSNSELKLIIFDFNRSKYYNHPMIYDVNYNKPEEIINDFNIILSNLSDVYFTTGYFLKDLLDKYGIEKITNKVCLIVVIVILIFTIFISVSCTFFCKKFCPSEIEENNNLGNNNLNNMYTNFGTNTMENKMKRD
jgi:uncharacterized protein YneF (UPF0154 family)